MRFPFGQVLRSPMKILRASRKERAAMPLALFTTRSTSSSPPTAPCDEIQKQPATSKLKTRGRVLRFFMESFLCSSEGKRKLRFESVNGLPAATIQTVILQLDRCMVVEVEPEAEGRTITAPYHRAIRRVTIDRIVYARIHVGVAKIGAVLAEFAGDLRVKPRGMKDSGCSGFGPRVPHEHCFVQKLILRVREHQV